MSLDTLKNELTQLLNKMYEEELLDEQFQTLVGLQNSGSPGFVGEMIVSFFNDCDRLLNIIDEMMRQKMVDYHKMNKYIHQLIGSSSSVGAHFVHLATIQLRHFCEANDKEGCEMTVEVVKHELGTLRPKLEDLMDLEKQIVEYDTVKREEEVEVANKAKKE